VVGGTSASADIGLCQEAVVGECLLTPTSGSSLTTLSTLSKRVAQTSEVKGGYEGGKKMTHYDFRYIKFVESIADTGKYQTTNNLVEATK